ncbi:MAG TPA: ABC transporter permease, partial [Planctomycetota bacterium]|nr:ABC transporter permease [Planctomycetota bacterium]
MFRWFIAYRYLFRLITLAALLAVTYSVAVLIVVVSVMEGFRTELEERIRGATSDIRIESEIFVGLERHDEVQALVRAIPGVVATAPVVETLALYRGPLSRAASSERLLLGMDLENPESLRDLDASIVQAHEAEIDLFPAMTGILASVPKSATE